MPEQRDPLQINQATYEWSVRIFKILKKILRVNLKLHHTGQVEAGEIFLFNHFARFETFIPQYLIYQETGPFAARWPPAISLSKVLPCQTIC